jgi:dihydrofolate reductase
MSRKIVVQEFLSVDGVMQAPGAKDEDTRRGFTDGGWQLPYYEATLVEFMIGRYKAADALLLGARTYKTFADYWPTAPDDGNPFVPEMNRLTKYVISNHPVELSWENSVHLKGDLRTELESIKGEEGKDIIVLGSSELAQTLMRHDLVDEYVLMVAPLKLGTGTRLFREDTVKQKLILRDSVATSTGQLILRYQVDRSRS